MAQTSWNAGEVVKLKKDGPQMVVNFFQSNGLIECVWFDEKKEYRTGNFNSAALVKA